MKIKYILTFILPILTGLVLFISACTQNNLQAIAELDEKTLMKAKELINQNKSKAVFLSFWPDMTKEEFELVKLFENKKGGLVNGFYTVEFPGLDSKKNAISVPLKFEVLLESNGEIRLLFIDTYEVRKTKKFEADPLGDKMYYKYPEIIKYFPAKFDYQYTRLTDGDIKSFNINLDNNSIFKKYRENSILSELNGRSKYFSQGNGAWIDPEYCKIVVFRSIYDRLTEDDFKYSSYRSPSKLRWLRPKNDWIMTYTGCQIEISYTSCDNLKEQIRKIEEEKRNREIEEQQKQENLLKKLEEIDAKNEAL